MHIGEACPISDDAVRSDGKSEPANEHQASASSHQQIRRFVSSVKEAKSVIEKGATPQDPNAGDGSAVGGKWYTFVKAQFIEGISSMSSVDKATAASIYTCCRSRCLTCHDV
jgi:hypothetical protein